MKSTLYIDPRIRDMVFIPLLMLMFIVAIIRYYVTKLMYAPESPQLEKAKISHECLKGTLLQNDADFQKTKPDDDFEISEIIKKIKPEA